MTIARVAHDMKVGERFDLEWCCTKPKNLKPMILCIRDATMLDSKNRDDWQKRLGEGSMPSGLDKSPGELVQYNKEQPKTEHEKEAHVEKGIV